MTCCCPHSRSGGRFFSLFARHYRRRFAKKGFEPSQQQLLQGLKQAGFEGATVLEIGSGVGHLHMSLLEQGAKSATGIDLAPGMIEQARDWAQQRGLAGRTRYLQGDFMEMLSQIEPCEVTVLDKVVCCYPDADGLVHRSLEKTGRVYALSYPRDRWYTRLGERLGIMLMFLLGSSFRPYVHDPKDIERWIRSEGFEKQFQRNTFLWLTQVYVRPSST